MVADNVKKIAEKNDLIPRLGSPFTRGSRSRDKRPLMGDLLPNVAVAYRLDNRSTQKTANMALAACRIDLNEDTFQDYYAAVGLLIDEMADSQSFTHEIREKRVYECYDRIRNKLVQEDGRPIMGAEFLSLRDLHRDLKGIIAESGNNDFQWEETRDGQR